MVLRKTRDSGQSEERGVDISSVTSGPYGGRRGHNPSPHGHRGTSLSQDAVPVGETSVN